MPSILIVEDHRDFRAAIKNFILKKGIKANIIEANTAEEGIQMAVNKHPEVIIMDIQLGDGKNGLEAASEIKKQEPKCGIIILSMYALEGLKKLCKNKDVVSFIDKTELDVKLIPALIKLLPKINPKSA